jgi:hypothetical protein
MFDQEPKYVEARCLRQGGEDLDGGVIVYISIIGELSKYAK